MNFNLVFLINKYSSVVKATCCMSLLGAALLFNASVSANKLNIPVVTNKTYSLSELLSAVIKNNPAMHGKQSEIEEKEHLKDSVKASRYPSASFKTGYVNSNYDDVNTEEAILNLEIKQPLWAFGRIDNNIAYAEMDVVVGKADLIRISRELLDQTVVAFTELESMKQQQAILVKSVADLQRLSEQIQRRYEGRVASKADVDLAFLRLIQARTQKNNMDGNVLLAMTELAALTQLPVNDIASLSIDLISLPHDDNDIVALALSNSAEITHKVRLLNLAQANTARERSSIMPTVYAQASKQIDDFSSSNGEQIGITIEASFDGLGFAYVGASKAAKSREFSSQEAIEVARTEVVRQVNSLIHSRKTQGDMVRVIDQSIGSFETILASYIRQYEAGKKTWLDVLNIQREMTSAQLELVNVRTQWYRTSLKLMVLVGALDVVNQREYQ